VAKSLDQAITEMLGGRDLIIARLQIQIEMLVEENDKLKDELEKLKDEHTK
jgi:hypothetical protein